MKNLIKLVTLILLTSNIAKGAVICEKKGRYWYPKNDKAVKIAKMLGVKTCTGKRFKKVVKSLGESSNVKASKKSMTVEEVIKAVK